MITSIWPIKLQTDTLKAARQTTNHILMIRPSHFGFNDQTADSNVFQSRTNLLSAKEISEKAVQEFDALVIKLRTNDVEVTVINDSPEFHTPDAVFPNNWISFHENGIIITYPMFAEVRRLERRETILNKILDKFECNATFSLTQFETNGQFLEGTGSMILDRFHKIAYACQSTRTHPAVFEKFCQLMGYKGIIFNALDEMGLEIYHTNVMMALGESFVVFVSEAVRNTGELTRLKRNFAEYGKELIDITIEQMKAFAGNMLQVKNSSGNSFLIMSTQAYDSLSSLQINQIEAHTTIVHSAINTIELIGGGSVRCMMAEVFLPPK